MTHFQQIFIQNLRFYRNKAGFSQLAFSEKIGLSPNYLNAVENGKNFPSADVIQKIIDVLNLLPYQLFLESPDNQKSSERNEIIQMASDLKQKVVKQIDDFIENCS
ncbi:MAG: helix-turn-helix transcriptional regulator [Treponema sp.]|nr:helix-turn-helix transcriptional regulator [Treponema sp.]